MPMTNEEFLKLQKTQIEIMDAIHDVCVKNNITYYIIGGTLLGAIRHKGFIPWDIDIDIAMPRDSYEKFSSICDSEMGSRYKYRDYKNTREYNYPHARVCIQGTKLYSKYDYLNPNAVNLGIYLDIFPLDKAPISIGKQKSQANRIKFLRQLKSYRIDYKYSNSKMKKIIRMLIRGVLFWVSVDRINVILDNEMRKYRYSNSGLLCSMASHYSYKKQCMSESIYGKPVLLNFANREYYGPEKYREYLERIFGDYMKLPPIEQQKANLDVFESVEFDK